jgi:hypothetical protein
MLNLAALAIAIPFAEAFLEIPDGFVKNRTLLIGFVVALLLAFFAKICLRRHEIVQAEQREENQEVAAVTRDGPPTFNG